MFRLFRLPFRDGFRFVIDLSPRDIFTDLSLPPFPANFLL